MSLDRAFKVGLVQMRCTSDPGENLTAAVAGIRAAAARGAQIVCLPELFRTLYFCQTEDHRNFDLAEAVPGPTTEALAAVARELQVAVVGSVFERRAPGLTASSFRSTSKIGVSGTARRSARVWSW